MENNTAGAAKVAYGKDNWRKTSKVIVFNSPRRALKEASSCEILTTGFFQVGCRTVFAMSVANDLQLLLICASDLL